MKKYLTISYILFTTLFIIAAFLRLYRLEDFAIFLGDQGRDAIIMKRIITFEHLTAIGPPSSIGQVFLGPFFYYLMAPFLPLFKFHPIGPVFGMVAISLTGLVCCYFMIKKEINTVVALLFTFLLTFSYINIDLSRFAWNPNPLPIFSFFTLYFFYKTLQTNKIYYPFLFGAFFSFSFQLHHLALLMGLPILITLILFIWKNSFKFSLVKKLSFAIIGFIIISSPLILFEVKEKIRNDRFLITESFIKTFTKEYVIAKTSLPNRFMETSAAFIQHSFQVKPTPFIGTVVFLLLAGAALWIYRKTEYDVLKIYILNFICFIVGFSLLNSGRHPHYFGTAYYSILIILAYMLYLGYQNRYLRYSLVPLVLIAYIVINWQNYHFFYKTPNRQMKFAERLADSIIPHIKKTPFQTVPLPITVTDGNVRYFLEIKGHRPLDVDSPVEGEELYVMCYTEEPCQILGHPQWQIAAFRNAKIEKSWKEDFVTISKLVHEKK